jgi:hypothetical protein
MSRSILPNPRSGARGVARPRALAFLAVLGGVTALGWLHPRRHVHPSVPPVPVTSAPSDEPRPRPKLAAPPPISRWKIAFVRDGDIWTANGDGSGQQRVIRRGTAPCWSPDRREIAFARDDNVWVAKADGSGERQLTVCPGSDAGGSNARPIDISWDRIENSITFSHADWFDFHRAGETETLHSSFQAIFDARPEDVREEIRAGRFQPLDFPGLTDVNHPAWSRSGRQLAFTRGGDIWLSTREERMGDEEYAPWNFTTTRLAAVAEASVPTYGGSSCYIIVVTHLSWSPDERSLAYSIRRNGGTSDHNQVHLLRLRAREGGLDVRQDRILADSAAWDPCFSPDGRLIAYVDGEAPWGSTTVCVVPAGGGKKRVLIRNADEPAW